MDMRKGTGKGMVKGMLASTSTCSSPPSFSPPHSLLVIFIGKESPSSAFRLIIIS